MIESVIANVVNCNIAGSINNYAAPQQSYNFTRIHYFGVDTCTIAPLLHVLTQDQTQEQQ